MPQDQWLGLLVKQSDPAKLRLFSPPISFTLLIENSRCGIENKLKTHVKYGQQSNFIDSLLLALRNNEAINRIFLIFTAFAPVQSSH
jgi:hypothetical protein